MKKPQNNKQTNKPKKAVFPAYLSLYNYDGARADRDRKRWHGPCAPSKVGRVCPGDAL